MLFAAIDPEQAFLHSLLQALLVQVVADSDFRGEFVKPRVAGHDEGIREMKIGKGVRAQFNVASQSDFQAELTLKSKAHIGRIWR
jgi:hypothetical protein